MGISEHALVHFLINIGSLPCIIRTVWHDILHCAELFARSCHEEKAHKLGVCFVCHTERTAAAESGFPRSVGEPQSYNWARAGRLSWEGQTKAWSRSYHSNLPADSVSTCQWGKAPDQLVHTGIWKYVLSFSLFTGKGLPEEIEHSIYLYWGDFRLQGSWAGRDLGSWGRIFRLCWNPDFLPPDFLHCWVSLWRANYLTSGPMPVLSRSLSALAPACQYVCSSFPAKLLCLTSHRSGMLAARLIVSTVTFHVFWQNVWCGSVRAESAKNISRGKSFSAATES